MDNLRCKLDKLGVMLGELLIVDEFMFCGSIRCENSTRVRTYIYVHKIKD